MYFLTGSSAHILCTRLTIVLVFPLSKESTVPIDSLPWVTIYTHKKKMDSHILNSSIISWLTLSLLITALVRS